MPSLLRFKIVDPTDQYVERFLFGEDGLYGKGDIFGPMEVFPIVGPEGIEIPQPLSNQYMLITT
ncbi:MAG: hypothetical protein U9R02_13115 [Thermodesulfobacteriota bacterium]|nr:hypothetical protein [Thermodesulfobacteriota bacterium]